MGISRYRYLHYDVFTDRRFGGNQLAVFPDAAGLPAHMMQQADGGVRAQSAYGDRQADEP